VEVLATKWILSSAILVIIPFVEATRKGRPSVLGFPLTVGLMTQIMTVAYTLSAYFLVFVLSGAARLHIRVRGNEGSITRAHAKATLYGYIIGMAVPTAVMLYMDHAYITAIWQPYPIFFTLVQTIGLLFSSPSEMSSSGYAITQSTYLFGFLSSAIAHFTIILPRLGDLPALSRLLLPSIALLDPMTTTLEQGIIDFLKWDGILCLIPCVLATFWFARDVKDFFGILAWHVVATLAFGPGAAIAGVFMWREFLLNEQDDKKNTAEEKRK
jgi:hypothetical protein